MDIKVNKQVSVHIFIAFVSVLLTVVSCDSSNNNNIPIQQVNSQDRLSDHELKQEQDSVIEGHQSQHKLKQEHQHEVFLFGFDLRASPQEDAAQYLPFLNYLERATGYHFKLHFTSKNSSTSDELGQNKIQFAAMGATSYLYAKSRYGAISLARGLNQKSKAEYQSVFVVRPRSAIRNIGDIKSHTLAFGSRDSTQGHLIPRIMLTENGISLDELRGYHFTGSHQNCVEAVVSRKSDVCGMQDQLAKKLAAQGQVKIIHTSGYYPSSGIVANKLVHPEVVDRVRQALLDFEPEGKHQQGLYHWDRTEMPKGFIAAEEADYEQLYKWAIQFGFLKENYDKE